ncbi:MAG: hypothetical protein K0R39_3377 [Symbiobacteriaceae bacterium]|jgi:hypothetical protein|nr:hypothetical protein [Symbiobacteriaceae bacterium]
MQYEIILAGPLPRSLADWFDGFHCTTLASGQTRLEGSVPDQAALIGLLTAITHMNLTLLLVRRYDRT